MIKKLCLIFSLLLFLIFFIVLPLPIPERVGSIDFRPYWSASYLFARGSDFSDLQALDQVERTLTAWNGEFTMQAWYTPIGHLLLSPLTLFPFPIAVRLWLLLNILILSVVAWLLGKNSSQKVWMPLLVVFSFSMTLTSLFFGQINTLSLLGFALFFHSRRSHNDLLAGFSLLLLLIKPHLVILTLPLLCLNLMRQRQWRVLAGFLLAGCLTSLLLFQLNPGWIVSFWKVAQSGLATARLTPSLAGVLVYLGEEQFGKWLWLGGLLLLLWSWWKLKRVDERTLCDITLLLGLALSPFGWSYDKILALIPILTIVSWIVQKDYPSKWRWFWVLALLLINGVTYYQRLVVQNDLWFFWVPLGLLGIYGLAHRQRHWLIDEAKGLDR